MIIIHLSKRKLFLTLFWIFFSLSSLQASDPFRCKDKEKVACDLSCPSSEYFSHLFERAKDNGCNDSVFEYLYREMEMDRAAYACYQKEHDEETFSDDSVYYEPSQEEIAWLKDKRAQLSTQLQKLPFSTSHKASIASHLLLMPPQLSQEIVALLIQQLAHIQAKDLLDELAQYFAFAGNFYLPVLKKSPHLWLLESLKFDLLKEASQQGD